MDRVLRWTPLGAVIAAIVMMIALAVPRIHDGSQSLRHVPLAMQDEYTILSNVWEMCRRNGHHHVDLNHGVAVYPGFYPYTVAIVQALSDRHASHRSLIERTRRLSLVTTVVALLLSFVLFARVARNEWVAAAFVVPLAIHPETVLWAARVHPDAFLLLFDLASLACFALHIDTRKHKYLVWATVLAALSAGTKLVGGFIMIVIGCWILWSERKDPKRLILRSLLHSAMFIAIFVVLNPTLFDHWGQTLDGWLIAHQRNVSDGPGRLAWFSTFTGPGGIGWAGTVACVFGIVDRVRTRRFDGLTGIFAFVVLFSAYILSSVSLALPRYGAPAMWPLFFIGLVALDASRWKKPRIAAAICACLVGVFLVVDVPPRMREIEQNALQYREAFTKEKEELANYLLTIPRGHRTRVISSSYAYVPDSLRWDYVWGMSDLPVVADDIFAIVVDDSIRREGGDQYRKLLNGDLGFTATATIGQYAIYTRGD